MPYHTCDCGKKHATVDSLIDCEKSGHVQFHDVEMQLRNLLAVIPNCESVHCHVQANASVFWACIKDEPAICSASYLGLVEKAEGLV